jgi:hypothetical protein
MLSPEAEQCQRALECECGAHAAFLQSLPVRARLDDGRPCTRIVFVFALEDYRFADRAYGWYDETLAGPKNIFAVMHVPPITGPRDAVRLVLETYRRSHPFAATLRQRSSYVRLLGLGGTLASSLGQSTRKAERSHHVVLPFGPGRAPTPNAPSWRH